MLLLLKYSTYQISNSQAQESVNHFVILVPIELDIYIGQEFKVLRKIQETYQEHFDDFLNVELAQKIV